MVGQRPTRLFVSYCCPQRSLPLTVSANPGCSVLVGRAAMYDMLTVFACYLAIIAGGWVERVQMELLARGCLQVLPDFFDPPPSCASATALYMLSEAPALV